MRVMCRWIALIEGKYARKNIFNQKPILFIK